MPIFSSFFAPGCSEIRTVRRWLCPIALLQVRQPPFAQNVCENPRDKSVLGPVFHDFFRRSCSLFSPVPDPCPQFPPFLRMSRRDFLLPTGVNLPPCPENSICDFTAALPRTAVFLFLLFRDLAFSFFTLGSRAVFAPSFS